MTTLLSEYKKSTYEAIIFWCCIEYKKSGLAIREWTLS